LAAARFADAATKAPGWIHTITGAGDAGSGSGVQMFNLRQSSLPAGSPVATLNAGQLDAVTALKVAGAQGGAACGGLQRSVPTGAAP
jgi:hypothetical protein